MELQARDEALCCLFVCCLNKGCDRGDLRKPKFSWGHSPEGASRKCTAVVLVLAWTVATGWSCLLLVVEQGQTVPPRSVLVILCLPCPSPQTVLLAGDQGGRGLSGLFHIHDLIGTIQKFGEFRQIQRPNCNSPAWLPEQNT